MSRPDIDADVQAAVAQSHVEWFPLVRMEFDSGTVQVCGADFDVEYPAGESPPSIFLSARGLGSIDPIVETPDEVAGIKFTLSGVPTAAIAEALTEPYQGRACSVMWAFIDGGVIKVDPLAWVGRLDKPEVVRGRATCTITVTAEHRMADWKRPRQLMFNHADQQRILPGDDFFLGIESMTEKEIIVFSKEVMRIS